MFVRQTHILLFELSPKTESCSKELVAKVRNSFHKSKLLVIRHRNLDDWKKVTMFARRYAEAQICRMAEEQRISIAEMQKCRDADMKNCRDVDMQICRSAKAQTCKLADTQTCRNVELQKSRYAE